MPNNKMPEESAAAVAALAGEVDGIQRRLAELDQVPTRISDLAEMIEKVAKLAAKGSGGRSEPELVDSWLAAPTDTETVRGLIDELEPWLRGCYLRYADAAGSLSDCWMWHADVVEELLWLQQAWVAAYQTPGAPPALAGDWHDRWRPGVVTRVRAAVSTCSLEAHLTGPGHVATAEPTVPGLDAVDSITDWWANHRTASAPEPTTAQLAASEHNTLRGVA